MACVDLRSWMRNGLNASYCIIIVLLCYSIASIVLSLRLLRRVSDWIQWLVLLASLLKGDV